MSERMREGRLRSFFAAVGALFLAGALLACGGGGSSGGGLALHHDFRTKPDGPVTKADSGQQWVPEASNAKSRLRVIDGRLTNLAGVTGLNSAGYIDAHLDRPVRRIGAEFTFSPYRTPNGTVSLVVWSHAVRSSFPTIPHSACHFALTPRIWVYSVISKTNVLTKVASGELSATLHADGKTRYRAEVLLRRGEARLKLPGGQVETVRDSRIASPGKWAGFEVFRYHPKTDSRASLTRVWADS